MNILFLFLFTCSCTLGSAMIDKVNISHEEFLVSKILEDTSSLIIKKYRLEPCGTGTSMPHGIIKKLALCFNIKGNYSKDQLRSILIDCATQFLKNVNQNSEIQKFLVISPFNINNVEIILYIQDLDGRLALDPNIGIADISHGKLSYTVYGSDLSISAIRNYTVETYDEAIKLLKS